MNKFGETLRELRVAQDLGLRELALKVGISPAYLSRIERGKERPPKPETVKVLAKFLAADPDVLFRLSSSTDPDIVIFLHDNQNVLNLIRLIRDSKISEEDVDRLSDFINKMKS